MQTEAEQALVRSINERIKDGKPSKATLETDDRVLARITDGIYRQPASALRELIANAYDADAENVYVQTDAPRFQQITVRDDGNGLTVESLANLIHHIGGSPKRTRDGVALGVANKKDPTLSPRGRRLIGKIGIGVFSVAQLTRHFQIITKTRGTSYRLVVEIVMRTYTEDDLLRASASPSKVQTGTVSIKSVPAADEESHGTEIILLDLRPQTIDHLQSRDLWTQVESSDGATGESVVAPTFHITRLERGKDKVKASAALPWGRDDPPGERFAKLYQAIVETVDQGESNPKLETILDNYLRMLWTLSLSAPLDYIEKHPFDLADTDGIDFFELSSVPKGQAKALRLKRDQVVREALGLHAPERGASTPFNVFVDDIQLKRPLRFKNLPHTAHVLKQPLMFIGAAAPDLSKIADEERGGDLSFEAYLVWTPKVVPKEHNGILVRIADASGTLFDETFMKYQVAELTRLRQITGEIFVRRGLDAALNIDRESFNYAHPHYQYLLKWLHRALRQLTNMHKLISSEKRMSEAAERDRKRKRKLSAALRQRLEKVTEVDDLPDVLFADDKKAATAARKEGTLAFDSEEVFADMPTSARTSRGGDTRRGKIEEQLAAIVQVLEAYGVFERMRYDKQQELLRAIAAVLSAAYVEK
jgi:hypothetical protein